MIDLSGISLPFNVNELLQSGSSLLFIVGPFLLAFMGFYMIDIFIGLFKHINYVHQATKTGYTREVRQRARKELMSGREIKHSIRMQFKGEWK